MGETGIRGAAKVARDEGEILREHIVVGAFGKLRRDAEAAVALVEIAVTFDELEVLLVGAVVSTAGAARPFAVLQSPT